MILSTTDTVPGKKIGEIKGIARGSSVRARNIAFDITSSIKNIVGGEISEYTKLQADSREQAIARMIEDATQLGADAVVSVRFESATVAQATSEIHVYGTAVTFG